MVWAPPYREILAEDMMASGWRPSVVEYLIDTAPVSSLQYVGAYGPTEDGKRHGDCSAEACATYIVNEDTYTQKHALSCKSSKTSPGCEYSTPPVDQVKQLILAEEISFADTTYFYGT